MDQKSSVPRKRLAAVNLEARISVNGNEEENFPCDKEATLEETVKNLHEQIACLVCECNAKDELMAEHLKTTQEAITGKEKAEAELAIWKQELEDTLQHNIAAYERLVHLNASLKNCRTQLNSLKLEQDQWVNLERAHKRLEAKYTEARKKLANLTLEKPLVKKEKLSNQISEANLVLKKDLKMRTVNADVANRQHQETANLEAERHKLRLLVKKRVPVNGKRKSVYKSMSAMIKKISEVEEENKSLKESLCERENEIRILKGEIEQNSEANLLELENKIVSLEMEVENIKLMNVNLDQQLFGAKLNRKEALRRVSVLEMELEDKNQQYQGLETICLELQLQLAAVSSKDEITEDFKQEGKLLQSGPEITTELTNNKLSPHSSLRDHMAAEDGFHRELMINEIISVTETKVPYGPQFSTCNHSFGVNDVVPQPLPIVPWKKRVKWIEWLTKLLYRRRGGSKKKLNSASV